jgi:hypothetical protein
MDIYHSGSEYNAKQLLKICPDGTYTDKLPPMFVVKNNKVRTFFLAAAKLLHEIF